MEIKFDAAMSPEDLLKLWTSPEVIEKVKSSRGQFIVVMGMDFQPDGKYQIASIVPPGYLGAVMPFALREFLSRFIMMCDQMNKQDEHVAAAKQLYVGLLEALDQALTGPRPAKKEMN